MKKIVYREATARDLTNIHRLIVAEHGKLTDPYPMINEAKLSLFLATILVRGKIWVADLSGRVIGAMVCSLYEPAWSDLKLISNNFFVVEEHFRKHGVADGLVAIVKRFAAPRRMPIWFEVTTGGRAELKDRFLTIRGAKYIGGRMCIWPADLPSSPEELTAVAAE